MAFFGKKENTADAAPKPAPDKQSRPGHVAPAAGSTDVSRVLIAPRVTEKVARESENGAYVFDVTKAATKPEIAKAIRMKYNVTPKKVATVPVPEKRVFLRGRRGVKSGGKKAYVYLTEGEKIELI